MISSKPLTSLALGAVLSVTLFCSHASRVIAEENYNLPASAEETTPLKTGDKAPSFSVMDVDGNAYDFDPAALDSPTVLISFRGGWCPYCNLHLSELRKVVPELQNQGVDVLFLSGDAPEHLYSSLKQETQESIDGLGYKILSDANIEAGRAFGTAFRTPDAMASRLGQRGTDVSKGSIGQYNALSVPFVYVVDGNGEIVFDFVEPDYKIRLEPDALLAAVDAAR